MNNQDLAKAMGVHVNTIQRWTTEKGYPPLDIAQGALKRIGYDLQAVRNENAHRKNAKGEDLSPVEYEKAIYERGRNSAFQDIKKKVNNVFDTYI